MTIGEQEETREEKEERRKEHGRGRGAVSSCATAPRRRARAEEGRLLCHDGTAAGESDKCKRQGVAWAMGCCSSSSAAQPSTVFSPGLLGDKYTITHRVLGQGTFGIVKVCVDRQGGTECALKLVPLNCETGVAGHVRFGDIKRLETEILVMRTMGSHPNILELYDAYRTPSQVQMVLEYARGGTLLDRLIADSGFSEVKVRFAHGCPLQVHAWHYTRATLGCTGSPSLIGFLIDPVIGRNNRSHAMRGAVQVSYEALPVS